MLEYVLPLSIVAVVIAAAAVVQLRKLVNGLALVAEKGRQSGRWPLGD